MGRQPLKKSPSMENTSDVYYTRYRPGIGVYSAMWLVPAARDRPCISRRIGFSGRAMRFIKSANGFHHFLPSFPPASSLSRVSSKQRSKSIDGIRPSSSLPSSKLSFIIITLVEGTISGLLRKMRDKDIPVGLGGLGWDGSEIPPNPIEYHLTKSQQTIRGSHKTSGD